MFLEARWDDLKDNLCLISHLELLHVCQKEEVSQQASLETQLWTSLLLPLVSVEAGHRISPYPKSSRVESSF